MKDAHKFDLYSGVTFLQRQIFNEVKILVLGTGKFNQANQE